MYQDIFILFCVFKALCLNKTSDSPLLTDGQTTVKMNIPEVRRAANLSEKGRCISHFLLGKGGGGKCASFKQDVCSANGLD